MIYMMIYMACAIQYEIIVVNDQTKTSAFHKGIKVRWAKLQSFTPSFFLMLHAKNY